MVEYFIIAIGIKVISIPEGLPLAVTATLGYSMKRMKDEKIQVRHLEACETLGSINNIVVDKTGILTTTQMEVDEIYIFEHKLSAGNLKNLPAEASSVLETFKTVVRVTCTDFEKIDTYMKKMGDRLSEALLG